MPLNARPRNLTDVFTRLFDAGAVATVATPGQLVQQTLLVRGGVTTLGLSAFPSIVRAATWFAVGDANAAATVGDTALGHETGRSQVLPPLIVASTALALSLLSPIAGNGIIWEIGLYGPGSHGAPGPAANSGTLYAHIILAVPVVKNASKMLTLEWAQG